MHDGPDDTEVNDVPHAQRCGLLSRAFATNKVIQSIDLSHCQFGDASIGALCSTIPSSLRYLVLQDNEISDTGAVQLAKALSRCPLLQKLDLSDNNIGNGGALALGKSLSACKGLEHLDVSWNSIGEKGADVILNGVAKCKQLRHLDLGDATVIKGLGGGDLP